jgi:hypothetical protein
MKPSALVDYAFEIQLTNWSHTAAVASVDVKDALVFDAAGVVELVVQS